MPNRIIKETIRTSKSINSLSDFEFRLWAYLITYVDDYGRGSADPELLKGLVFPRRKAVKEAQIKTALKALADAELIALYVADGEPFFYFPKWTNHQRIQTKKSKFPEPPKSTVIHGDLQQFAASCGEPPPESNPIQSNPNTESNTESNNNNNEGGKENPEMAEAMSFFLDRINSTPSPDLIDKLRFYVEQLSGPVVIRALSIALDEKKTSWSYIQAILQNYLRDGLTTLDAVNARELERGQAKAKGGRHDDHSGNSGKGADERWNLHAAVE